MYRDLAPEVRAELHYGLGRALEQRYGDGQGAVDQVGEHYRLAGESGKAYVYLVSAAKGLWLRGLSGQAWEISSRAMAIEDLSRVDLDPSRLKEAKLMLLQVRADVVYTRGEWSEARNWWKRVGNWPENLAISELLRILSGIWGVFTTV